MNSHHQFGQEAERAVEQFLSEKQFLVIHKNYRVFEGEIDLIAQKKDIVTFVEVKARTSSEVSLYSLVTMQKQLKIIKAARKFIAQHTNLSVSYRFDVALVSKKECGAMHIEYVEDAFRAGE